MGRAKSFLLATILFSACNFEVGGIGQGPKGPADPGSGMPDDPSTQQPAGTNPAPPGATPPAAPMEIGAPCDAANPCAGGAQCFSRMGKDTSFPGGYCSMDCRTSACPSGSKCWSYDKDQFCILECASSCRPGYRCCDHGSSKACLPDSMCDN